MFLREGKPIMEAAISQAREIDVPVHTMIRLDRRVDRAILETARESKADLMLVGWPGRTEGQHQAFGSTIDLIARDPPCDLAVVRFRKRREPRRILVPVAGGTNTKLAIRLAIDQARRFEKRWGESPVITLLHVCVPAEARPEVRAKAFELLRNTAAGYDYPLEVTVRPADNIAGGIIAESSGHDLVVLGATAERLFDQVVFGTVPERVMLGASVTVMMVKRYRGPVRTWIRRSLSWLFALGERRRARRKG
jgi:CIC family chloride channel protein